MCLHVIIIRVRRALLNAVDTWSVWCSCLSPGPFSCSLTTVCFSGIIPALDFPADSRPACWLHLSSLTSLCLPVTDSSVCRLSSSANVHVFCCQCMTSSSSLYGWGSLECVSNSVTHGVYEVSWNLEMSVAVVNGFNLCSAVSLQQTQLEMKWDCRTPLGA